jgi:hypothetical protein
MDRLSRVGWNGTPHYRRAGVDFLVQEIQRSREFLSSIPKQALEAGRRQLGITHRMLDRLMAEIGLDGPGVDAPGVGFLVAKSK